MQQCKRFHFHSNTRRNSKQSATAKSANDFFPMTNLKERQGSMANRGYNNEDSTHEAEGTRAEMVYQEVNDEMTTYEELLRRETDGSYEKITSPSNSFHGESKAVSLCTSYVSKYTAIFPY